MVKVLAQAGTSLADHYDVVGSRAGVDELVSREVSLVHEMGATMASERMSGGMWRSQTGAIAQNITWDIVLTGFPIGISRMLGVVLLSDAAARIEQAMVALRDPLDGREFPLISWEATNDSESIVRIVENGAAVGNRYQLITRSVETPNLRFGTAQPQPAQDIAFRGVAAAFGAGTVNLVALVYIAYMRQAGVSSYGIPIPGW